MYCCRQFEFDFWFWLLISDFWDLIWVLSSELSLSCCLYRCEQLRKQIQERVTVIRIKYEKNICKSLKKNKYQHDSITENKTYCIWIPKSCMLHYLFGIFLFFVFFFRVWVSLCFDWLMCLLNWNWNWNLLQYLPVFFPDFVFQIPFLAFTNIHTLVILFANFLQLAWKIHFGDFVDTLDRRFDVF